MWHKWLTLVDAGAVEAHNFRLFESGRQKFDVGAQGFRDYFNFHWLTFLKHRWAEHLWGEKEHPEFGKPEFFGHMLRHESRFDERIVKYVKQRFLGKHDDCRAHWELSHFSFGCDVITADGFDFFDEIIPVLSEFSFNDWHLNWTDFYWINGDQLIVVNRVCPSQRQLIIPGSQKACSCAC